jgi:hypothetical protein
MKKTLVALAVLAASGASFAQVALTGTMSFGYQKSLNDTHGIAMYDNSFNLAGSEDLGGGTSIAFSTGFDAGGRGSAANANNTGNENASLAVSGGFGKVTLTSFESDGPFANIEGLSGASLPVGLFDVSGITGGKRFRNGLLYSTPAFGAVTVGVSYVTLAGQYTSADVLDAKTKVTPSITYASGPLKAYLEYSVFNASYNNTSADPITQPTAYVTYDFGAAKVGASWSKASNSDPFFGLGVSVPVGALTLGLATFSANSSAALGSATWTEASVGYSLSKRTTLKASFGQANDSAVALSNASALASTGGVVNAYGLTGGLTTNTQSRVGLTHTF